MRIFDRKRINARTVIEQLEILFNMGRQLEDEVINKQDELIAGENITIVDNVISANPGSFTTVDSELSTESTNPVENKVITNKIVDIETYMYNKQDKLIAGDNITIVGNVISATGGGTGSGITAHTFSTIGEVVTAVINHTNSFVRMNISGTIVTADYQLLVNGLQLTTPMIPIDGQIDSARGLFVASSTQTTQEIQIFTLMFDSNGVRTVTSNYLISVNDIIVYYWGA